MCTYTALVAHSLRTRLKLHITREKKVAVTVETVTLEDIRRAGGRHLRAVVVPGWIGRGRDLPDSPSQYRPLLDGALGKFGNVSAIDFATLHAPTLTVAQDLAVELTKLSLAAPAVILASSYGAMMALLAAGLYGNTVMADSLKLVLVDPPAGGESLVSLQRFRAVRLAKKIGWMPEWLNADFPQGVFDKLFCPGLADTDPIEVPAAIMAQGADAVDAYIEQVRKDAFDGQQGFPLTLCAEQIGAMAQAVDMRWLPDACKMIDGQYDVTRIVCTHNNQVVDPAISDPFFNAHLPSAVRIEAARNHTDYAQFSGEWNRILTPLL